MSTYISLWKSPSMYVTKCKHWSYTQIWKTYLPRLNTQVTSEPLSLCVAGQIVYVLWALRPFTCCCSVQVHSSSALIVKHLRINTTDLCLFLLSASHLARVLLATPQSAVLNLVRRVNLYALWINRQLHLAVSSSEFKMTPTPSGKLHHWPPMDESRLDTSNIICPARSFWWFDFFLFHHIGLTRTFTGVVGAVLRHGSNIHRITSSFNNLL